MKFGDLIKGFSERCGNKCIDFIELTSVVDDSPTFATALVDAIVEVDDVYEHLYFQFLNVAEKTCFVAADDSTNSNPNDELVASIHGLYEFAVWNLICIEKITKKHDKRHSEKIRSTVHRMVKNTFMYSNLADSELYKMLPKLEQSADNNNNHNKTGCCSSSDSSTTSKSSCATASSSTSVPTSSCASEASTAADDFCSVCIAQVKCTIKLDCGHSFCLGCANSLSKHFFTNCPECRADVSPNPVSAIAKQILGVAPNPGFSLLKLESDDNASPATSASKSFPSDGTSCHGVGNDCCNVFANESDPDVLEIVKRLRHQVEQETLQDDFINTIQHDGIGPDGGIDEVARQKLMVWLRELSTFFCLSPGTFATASSLVDRMLSATRVKNEHGDLAAMACLFIASKLDEPEDLQPTLRELSINCGRAFTERDIERMAEIVRRKVTGPLEITPFDFVDDMVGLCRMLGAPDVVAAQEFERVLVKRVVACSAYYELLSYRPSTLALAVCTLHLRRVKQVNTELEDCELFVEKLQGALNVEDWDLDNCCRRVSATIDGAVELQPIDIESNPNPNPNPNANTIETTPTTTIETAPMMTTTSMQKQNHHHARFDHVGQPISV